MFGEGRLAYKNLSPAVESNNRKRRDFMIYWAVGGNYSTMFDVLGTTIRLETIYDSQQSKI